MPMLRAVLMTQSHDPDDRIRGLSQRLLRLMLGQTIRRVTYKVTTEATAVNWENSVRRLRTRSVKRS